MKIKIVVFLVLFLPLLSFADTIVLKSGKQIVSDKVWVDGGKVRCSKYGTTISFPIENVERIDQEPDAVIPEKRNNFRFDVWSSGVEFRGHYT